MQRIPLVTLDDCTDEQRAFLTGGSRPSSTGGINKWTATMANHPRLAAGWNTFGSQLIFEGTLPGRDRELLSLRAAFNTDGAYPWSSHARYGRAEGLSVDEIEGAAEGPDSGKLGQWERCLVRAADELAHDHRVSDTTWAELAERYSNEQLLEVCVVVGQYTMIAYTLNSAGVGADGAALGSAE